MARIQKRTRKDGSTAYVAKWRTITGQDRSKTFANKRAAEAHLTKVNAGKLRGMEYDPASGGILFREAAQVWLAARTDLKPSTHAAHAERLAPTTDETRARHARLVHNGQPLRIDPTFGDYPLNCITRDDVQAWVNRLVASGRKPSSVRNLFFVVRQVLEQAVVDGRLPVNPAEHVKLPTEHTDWTAAVGGAKAIPASDFGYSDDVLPGDGLPDYEALRVDDPAQFLSAAQVSALVSATPWPYNVFEHVAAWTGLRPGRRPGCASEMCGSLHQVRHRTARHRGSRSSARWPSLAGFPRTSAPRRRAPGDECR